jgi:tetratricopeptide (TPR) repeat protein
MRIVVVALALFLSTGWQATHLQSSVRGQVVDEEGKPIPDVNVELQFLGGGSDAPKQTFKSKTNNRGYYMRVGLPEGRYKIVFDKAGYLKQGIEMSISFGGLSEAPPETLKRAPATPPAAAPKSGEGGKPTGEGGVPTGAAAILANEIKASFAKAVEAAKGSRFDEAEALYKDILTKMPDFAPAHFNLGYVYRAKKDFAAAEASFQKALALEPARADTHVALAGTYRAMGDAQKALDVLVKGASQFESDGGFQYELGIGYLNAGKNDEAVAALKKAESLDPANIEIQFYLGTLAVARADMKEATARLEKYVAGTNQNARNLATAQGILKTIKK